MVRSVMKKVMWVGRATVFMVGLAVILALVLGVATAALAGTGIGATFNLGKLNKVNEISRLVGSTNEPMLRVVNNNAATNATALDLQVEEGHAPMRVNSSTQVLRLDADLLDNKSADQFMEGFVYKTEAATNQGTALGDGTAVRTMSCDVGDTLLSGGPASVDASSKVLDSFALNTTQWQARISPAGDSFTVAILCADSPPLHQT